MSRTIERLKVDVPKNNEYSILLAGIAAGFITGIFTPGFID
jgi:uncharacterized membrane protein YfcA